jgi:hypothetical protein
MMKHCLRSRLRCFPPALQESPQEREAGHVHVVGAPVWIREIAVVYMTTTLCTCNPVFHRF